MKPRLQEAALLLAIFFDMVGFTMLIPNIQLRADTLLGSTPLKGPIIGLLLQSTFIIQLIASPQWGRFADRVGGKKIFVACQWLSALAMLLYGLAESIPLLFLSRIMAGFGSANIAVGQSMIVASTDEAQRKVVLGRLGAAISAGSILGPAIGGFSAHYFGNHWIGVVGAGISAVGGLLVLAFVSEIKPAPKEHQKLKWIDLSFFQKYPSIKPFFWIAVAASFALATLEGTFGRLIRDTLGYGEREFGIIFSYEGLLGVLVSAFFLQWLGRKFCDTTLLRIGYVLQGVGLVINPFVAPLIGIAPGMVWLLLASTFYAVGAGVVSPTLSALTSNAVPDDAQGELFGNLQAARTFGFIIGPIIGGALFDVWHAAPYIFAALVCLAVAVALPAICACHPKKA